MIVSVISSCSAFCLTRRKFQYIILSSFSIILVNLISEVRAFAHFSTQFSEGKGYLVLRQIYLILQLIFLKLVSISFMTLLLIFPHSTSVFSHNKRKII